MKLRTEYAIRQENHRKMTTKKKVKQQARLRTRRMAEVQAFTWELPREKKLRKTPVEKLDEMEEILQAKHEQEAKAVMGEKEKGEDSGLGEEEEGGHSTHD